MYSTRTSVFDRQHFLSQQWLRMFLKAVNFLKLRFLLANSLLSANARSHAGTNHSKLSATASHGSTISAVIPHLSQANSRDGDLVPCQTLFIASLATFATEADIRELFGSQVCSLSSSHMVIWFSPDFESIASVLTSLVVLSRLWTSRMYHPQQLL
jgi:hypothetical protein